jgi:DNA-binding CsgD family transcriptional regulator
MSYASLSSCQVSSAAPTGFPELIGSIGEQRFGAQLLAFLNKACGAEHSAVFKLQAGNLAEIVAASVDGTDIAHRQSSLYIAGQLWRKDPTLWEAQERLGHGGTALVRTDISHLADHNLRDVVYGSANIRDRVLICGRSKDGMIGLSILRSTQRGPFSEAELEHAQSISAMVLSILAKHASLLWNRPDLSVALTSRGEIEACIAAAPEAFPRREAEVCARIIYGISSTGIALDLGIGEETVMTYRKRAYQRLGIATQRELLVWYIATWSRWAANPRLETVQ